MDGLRQVELSKIKASKTNPRKIFDKKLQAELVESIRAHGILQPILLRPVGEDVFEVVAGERRFRAAKEAELGTVPAFVREMDDRTVIEVQVIENLQREDLHPLEEASGYEALLKNFSGVTVDDIAAKVGKSKAYVYGRLKLCELIPSVRDQLWGNKIQPSIALLIARLPSSVQEQAANSVGEGYTGEPMSYARAHEYITNTYMLMLQSAPFSTKDSALVPEAGACTGCPKRTGNQPELFGDVGKDLCLDSACFAAKRMASWEKKTQKLRNEGYSILPLEKRERFKDWDHYDIGEECPEDPKKRSFKKLLDTMPKDNFVVVADSKGNPQVKVKRSVAAEFLQKLGAKVLSHHLPEKVSREEQEREQKLSDEFDRMVIAQIIEKIFDGGPQHHAPLMKYAANSMLNFTPAVREHYDNFLTKTGAEDREEITIERFWVLTLLSCFEGEVPGDFDEVIKEYNLDVKAIRRQAMKNVKELEKTEKAGNKKQE